MEYDGMIEGPDGRLVPGAILRLWAEARRAVGVVKAKKKEGVRFKVRSNEDLVDALRRACNELGILVYPRKSAGRGHVVEDGTLAEVDLSIVVQAVEDGSRLLFAGFGLGADNQDKAGGKAGTYAFKQALIQALLAGGADDTDDTDTPIKGGVKPKAARVKLPTEEDVRGALEGAATEAHYRAAVEVLKQAAPETQVALRDVAFAAKARCITA